MFLVVYVDDFKLAGPSGNIPKGWALIRKGIQMDDPTDMGLYLGCEHHQSTETVSGLPGMFHVANWDMESYLRNTLETYHS